jgi:hypothetical protein
MNQDPIPQPELERQGLTKTELSQTHSDHLEKDREELAAWLNKNPEEASHFEDLQDLVSLCRKSEPSYPSNEAWEPVLRGVVAGISAAGVTGTGTSGGYGTLRFYERAIRTSLMGAAAAAALLLAVLLPHEKSRNGIDPNIPFLGPEGIPIVDVKDVEVMSMERDDIPLLVVGNPPESFPLVLAGHADIKFGHATDEFGAPVPMIQDSDSPMIVAPLAKQNSKPRRGP